MIWADVASAVGRSAPILATILGGPVGAAVSAAGALVASALGVPNNPSDVAQALQTNPDAAVKLAQIESDERVKLQGLLVQAAANQVAAETSAVLSVNATMQEEAKSEHWLSYSWRPILGLCVGFNTGASSILVLVIFIAIMLGNKEATAAMAQLPGVLGALGVINATVLPILGIASWFRGKAQADPSNDAPVKG